MRQTESTIEVKGPWSIGTSRRFWEGFSPAPLGSRNERWTEAGAVHDVQLATTFRVETDWTIAQASVEQRPETARIVVAGDGDLDAAIAQVTRFLSLDIDARPWPDVAARDPVIAEAQSKLPGLRPCGFHSPYEAAAWAVLSQRVRIPQAATLRRDLIARHSEAGAFPSPQVLRSSDLDLPGRKSEYLKAVAEAALDGRLITTALRSLGAVQAMREVQQIKGLGPFASELVVIRGATASDVLPSHERAIDALIVRLYGPDRSIHSISEAWRPFRTWSVVLLRARAEQEARLQGTPGS